MTRIPESIDSWLCFYGGNAPPEAYGRFDLVVFDSTFHPPLVRRADGGPVLLGYLSAAEVLEQGPFWSRVKDRNILLRRKPFWNSWVLDVRDEAWQDLLIHEAVPRILGQGFDGVLVDTLDSALGLELWTDPARFQGTCSAVVKWVQTLRRTFPYAVIVVNRGLPLLPDIAASLNAVVVEGLFSTHQDGGSGYAPVAPEVRDLLLRQVEAGRADHPQLPVLTLDYASEYQPGLAQDAIAYARRKGFVPYVSTIPLDRIHDHTLDRRGAYRASPSRACERTRG
jgi:uncharacterized protein (TIGR01370 family)